MLNRGVNSVITEMPESRQECFVAAGGGGEKIRASFEMGEDAEGCYKRDTEIQITIC